MAAEDKTNTITDIDPEQRKKDLLAIKDAICGKPDAVREALSHI